jgi:hypothetical protein
LNINTVPTQAWSAKIARCQSAENPTEFQIYVAAADDDEMPQEGIEVQQPGIGCDVEPVPGTWRELTADVHDTGGG